MRKLTVWGGLKFVNGKQLRTIIATKTKKEAVKKLGISIYEFNTWWCETGNDIETEIALKNDGIVFVASSSMGKDFSQL